MGLLTAGQPMALDVAYDVNVTVYINAVVCSGASVRSLFSFSSPRPPPRPALPGSQPACAPHTDIHTSQRTHADSHKTTKHMTIIKQQLEA